MARKKDPYDWGTGRRKTAVARVRMKSGTGKFVVNKRELDKYFTTPAERLVVRLPLKAAGCVTTVDIIVNAHGGGTASQAGAVCLGVARALLRRNPEHEAVLRDGKFLTRDSRVKERKKYGRKGARKSFQFSKR
ncbi:MAG: 30S ribosomal protein S9 [Planctomycetota bacterium]|nr:30S ribosomal protein S9 [Planctomycetota bacterium]